jgi:hypothetical protein
MIFKDLMGESREKAQGFPWAFCFGEECVGLVNAIPGMGAA